MVDTPISIGELLDKLTILRIKQQHISDPNKIRNINTEYNILNARYSTIDIKQDVEHHIRMLTESLHAINKIIWDVEDEIRSHESRKEFNNRFIELARSVYYNNDERARIKREINKLLDSKIIEEKSYADYTQANSNGVNL